MLQKFRIAIQRLLEVTVCTLLLALVIIVVVAVVYRKSGHSLVWYDEVASIVLAWLTYYGAALAALKRSHIGYSGLVDATRRPLKFILLIVAEAAVIGFFILLAWVGYKVLLVLEGDSLVSLPAVSVQITQSVIPIGAALFVIAQVVSLPDHWRRATSTGARSAGTTAVRSDDQL
ncbi:MAG: TRAP transporter small permease subunit [Gammaproteobacteria bacterium]|nr:TRAP transporter small permease subunit [Gammaproteobacteria bacterium]MDH3464750.1 TRAP transporter small permease subunit [Gammaproteobacteria bacterium]